jgi:hypothetical protein
MSKSIKLKKGYDIKSKFVKVINADGKPIQVKQYYLEKTNETQV